VLLLSGGAIGGWMARGLVDGAVSAAKGSIPFVGAWLK
jgi:hypothetical protein